MSRRAKVAGMAGIASALVVAAAVRPAAAQTEEKDASLPAPIALVDESAAPFSSAELAQALLARLFPGTESGPPHVRIEPARPGAVNVRVGDRSRVVSLDDRSGPAAARVVALVIAELMSDADEDAAREAAETPAAPPAVTVARAGNAAPASNAAPAVSLAAAPARAVATATPPRLYLTGGVAKGLGEEERLAATVDADVVLPLGSGLRLAPSAGLVYMPTRNAGTWNEVGFKAAAARLLGGTSWGQVELLGGPFVSRYSIEGVSKHDGFLFGAEVMARLTLPLSRRAGLVVATRAHAYGNRVRVVWPDASGGYATPRLELTIGVGLAWDWAS